MQLSGTKQRRSVPETNVQFQYNICHQVHGDLDCLQTNHNILATCNLIVNFNGSCVVLSLQCKQGIGFIVFTKIRQSYTTLSICQVLQTERNKAVLHVNITQRKTIKDFYSVWWHCRPPTLPLDDCFVILWSRLAQHILYLS